MAGQFECYRGMYECPKCGSRETGTNTISTSGRWIDFRCLECRHDFKKSAANTSPLSKHLRGLAGAVQDFLADD